MQKKFLQIRSIQQIANNLLHCFVHRVHKVHQPKIPISLNRIKRYHGIENNQKLLRLHRLKQIPHKPPPETRAETPANATEADTKAVADRVIYYLNRARANIGSGELKKLPRLTGYAEYRSSQLPSNFAHDISDWFAAAKATGYGRYTEMPDGSGSYDIGAQEAIAMSGIVGSADKIGECLAQIIIESHRHWPYVGSDEMKYTGVGVTCVDDLWYTCIMVTATDKYEK